VTQSPNDATGVNISSSSGAHTSSSGATKSGHMSASSSSGS
jgi:hypothetical protein